MFQNVGNFFAGLNPFRLEPAPGGKYYITKDEAVITREKVFFAENCATCHSSKRPPAGEDEIAWFRQEALKPDFREDNFFSVNRRYPITKIQTNATRACATNAIPGQVYANSSPDTNRNFTSE